LARQGEAGSQAGRGEAWQGYFVDFLHGRAKLGLQLGARGAAWQGFMRKEKKMWFCFCCGAELGVYADHDWFDTCGESRCEMAAREAVREEPGDDGLVL
jgi:hypothetical protein